MDQVSLPIGVTTIWGFVAAPFAFLLGAYILLLHTSWRVDKKADKEELAKKINSEIEKLSGVTVRVDSCRNAHEGTKLSLDSLSSNVRGAVKEMSEIKDDISREIGDIKSDISNVKADMAEVKTDIKWLKKKNGFNGE